MARSEPAFRHIVDLDGQLAGIEEAVVDPATLLARAGRGSDRRLYLVQADGRVLIEPQELVRLSENEVLFFETALVSSWQLPISTPAPTWMVP